MENRGFKRLDCGTNRLVFKFMEDQSIVVKVAFDRVAINDNLREFKNQEILKPYCTKCFEVSPCGTVGLFERVEAITKESLNKEVIYAMYDVSYDIIRNGYLLDDFGGNYYKNWGIREVDGKKNLVILDYPYVYEPDLTKLTCNNQDPMSPTGYCGGQYEYDAGFNFIRCEKCGKVVSASELAKTNKSKTRDGLIIEREETDMMITIEKNGKTIVLGAEKESSTYNKKLSRKEYKMKKAARKLEVTIERGDHSELNEPEEPRKFIGNGNTEPITTDRIRKVDEDCKKLEVTLITSKGDEFTGRYCEYPNYGIGAKIVRTVDGKELETNYDTIEPIEETIANLDMNKDIETVECNEPEDIVDPVEEDESGSHDDVIDAITEIVKYATRHDVSAFTESEEIVDEYVDTDKDEIVYKDSETVPINNILADKLKDISLEDGDSGDNNEERDLDLKPRKVYKNNDEDISNDILDEY